MFKTQYGFYKPSNSFLKYCNTLGLLYYLDSYIIDEDDDGKYGLFVPVYINDLSINDNGVTFTYLDYSISSNHCNVKLISFSRSSCLSIVETMRDVTQLNINYERIIESLKEFMWYEFNYR